MDGDEQLTPEEVEALTEALRPSDPRDVAAPPRESPVAPYDLIGAAASAAATLPGLQVIHEQFANTFATALTRATRRKGDVLVRRPHAARFSEVYGTIETPTGLFFCEVRGLGTTGLIVIEAELFVHLVDLMIGGRGKPGDHALQMLTARGLSPTESRLARHLVDDIDVAVRSSWRHIRPVSLQLLRAEVDPRRVAVFEASELMLDLAVELKWAGVHGAVRILLPMAALKPLEDKLAVTAVAPGTPAQASSRNSLANALMDVEVEAVATAGNVTLTLGQLRSLKVGDLLRLNRGPEGEVPLFIEGVPKLVGTPEVRHGNMAVRITDKVERRGQDEETQT